jgi:ADP-ribosylglycohydrolase
MLTEAQRAQALLYGLACGDALGYAVEFINLRQIKAAYGPQGIRDLPRPARFSDDTQMSIATARALVDHGDADYESLLSALAARYVEWYRTQDDPDQRRDPGRTCLEGAAALERGVDWRLAGVPDQKGCGAVMRVAPVGYVYQHDLERLVAVARGSAIMTHGHPTSTAATVGTAYVVKLALDGMEPIEIPYRMLELVGDESRELAIAIGKVLEVVDWPLEEGAMRRLGVGWTAEEALALALYCFLRYPDDYVACIVRAANSDGDSDSVACVAGAFAAARLAGQGRFPIPNDWVERIERSAELAALGEGLAAAKRAWAARTAGQP